MNNEPIEATVYQVVVNIQEGGDVYQVTTDFVTQDSNEWITVKFKCNLDGIDLSSHVKNIKRSKFIEDIVEKGTATDTWKGTRENEEKRIIQKMKEMYGEEAQIDIKSLN